jgi:raffinose/stachyose/melibiose transport system permease protein
MDYTYHFGRGIFRLIPYLLLLPGLSLYLLVALGPSLATAIFSFTDASGLPGTPIHWVGLANYNEFLLLGAAVRDNIAVVGRTLAFSFFVTTIQTAIGLLIAVLLNVRLKGTNFFRALFFLPVILGVAIQGLIWTLFLYPLDGPAQKILELFGTHANFLGGLPREAFAWVICVQIWANMGITMVIFLAGLQTIPDELFEAARIDGASGWQSFRYITFPLLTPSLSTNLLLAIIGSLQAWQLLLVMLGIRNGTQVLGLTIYSIAFGRQTNNPTGVGLRQGYAAAASMVLFVLVLVIGLTTQYLLRRREEQLLG